MSIKETPSTTGFKMENINPENVQNMNIDLLVDTKKDLDLLEGVYGKKIFQTKNRKKKRNVT